MEILKNLEELKEENLKMITELFSIKNDKNKENIFQEIEKTYLKNVQRLYSYLPIKTHIFLEHYFENNGLVPYSDELFKCAIKFEKFGLCPSVRVEEGSNFIKVSLDNKISKTLYNFLSYNTEQIFEEIELNDVILGVLNSYLVLKVKDLIEILIKLGIHKNETEILDFLKFKLDSDIYKFQFDSDNELIIINNYVFCSDNILEKLLIYKGEREIHPLNEYIKLSHYNILEDEIENISSTIKPENKKEFDEDYIGFYLMKNVLLDASFNDCLKEIKNVVPGLDINDSIVRQNIARCYNKIPIAPSGIINQNRIPLQ